MTEAASRRRLAAHLLLGLAFAAPGCGFHRGVVNEGVRDLDPSGIHAGRTTLLEVVKQLGLPPPETPEEVGTRVVSRDYLRYSVLERRCFRIGFEEFLLITPFRWCAAERIYELGIEFDEDAVVSGVYEATQGVPWRPFQSESSKPVRARKLSGSTR